MRYHLIAKEHEEHGFLGCAFKYPKENRKYLEPGNGNIIAHDIIEHTTQAHPDLYTDELMALGAIIAGRVENSNSVSLEDAEADLVNMITSAFQCYNRDSFAPYPCSLSLRSHVYNDIVEMAIRAGQRVLLLAEDEGMDITEEFFDTDNVVGWISRGYQRFKKRFPDRNHRHAVCNDLYDEISEKVNKWIKYAHEGNEAILSVHFSYLRSDLEGLYV